MYIFIFLFRKLSDSSAELLFLWVDIVQVYLHWSVGHYVTTLLNSSQLIPFIYFTCSNCNWKYSKFSCKNNVAIFWNISEKLYSHSCQWRLLPRSLPKTFCKSIVGCLYCLFSIDENEASVVSSMNLISLFMTVSWDILI